MNLSQCEKECEVKVIKLHAKGALKDRLISFGLMKGADIKVLAHAPAKSTIEIIIARTRLALRREEAELIEVAK